MELTKQDTQKAKGVAIIAMVMLHLFCRLGELPYTAWLYIGETPIIYYLGLFGDICVPIYCFCSGYAHFLLKENNTNGYNKSIPKRILRFLLNFWIVVVLFSIVGLLTGNGADIPGSFKEFLGNFLLYGLSYNGAWWFVLTYIFLTLLSPVLIVTVKKVHPVLMILFSGLVYTAAYFLRFQYTLNIPNALINWLWQQLILIGTSQLAYIVGMVCRKEKWATKLRVHMYKEQSSLLFRKCLCFIVYLLPLAAFIVHCRFQSLILAPFTAAAVLISLFATNLPLIVDRFLLFMGRHSTNIWLVHMFFYMTLFEGFVFRAKYPLLILLLMLAVCILVSVTIQFLNKVLSRVLKLT